MSKLLRKMFIKDYQNVNNPVIRTKHGILAALVGIVTNLILFGIKLAIGLIIFSMSIISDAINNLTDMASCFVSLFGFKLAGKPADKDHPFGHERIEYIAGLIVSLIIIAIAVVAGYSSVMKLISNEVTSYTNQTFVIATFAVLGVAILGKLWQSSFYRRMSKAIASVTLKANAQDSLNDVISTSVVLVSTIVEYVLYKNGIIVNIDPWMGIAVSLFIIYSGIKMVLETSNPLIGITPDNELVKKVVTKIINTEGVHGVHDLMCHSYGPTKIFMTIHVEVDSKIDVLESHDLMDRIEQDIQEEFGVLLTVHMDPIVLNDPFIDKLKEKTTKILADYDNSLRFHDFRVVKGTTHTNILFDVLMSFENKKSEDEVKEYLKQEFKKLDKTYNLVIKIDRDYVEKD